MDKLDQLLDELEALSSQPLAQVDRARLIKVKELIGEVGGQEELLRKFGGLRMELLSAPRRGQNGVIILDILFELDDGKFVLAEAKYGVSQIGRAASKRTSLVTVSGGKVTQTVIPLKQQTQQLDSRWIKDRIEEIGKDNERLSKALKEALDADKLQVFEARTRIDATPGRKPTLATQLTDHTGRVREEEKIGRRLLDHERRFAIREGLADYQLQGLAAKAKDLQGAVKEARAAEKAVESELAKARRSLARLKQTPGKPLTVAQVAARERWAQATASLEEKLKPLKRATAEAEKALAGSREAAKLAGDARDYAKRARKAEAKFKREAMAKLLAEGRASGKFTEDERKLLDRRIGNKPTPMPEADPPATHNARPKGTTERPTGSPQTADRHVADRGLVKAERGAAKSAAAKTTARAAAEAADVAAKGGRLSRLAFRGSKLVIRAGSLVFKVINFFDPVFLLMDAVSVIDALVAWIRRDKIENEKEWKRIAQYLFGPLEIYTGRFGVKYPTTMGHQIEAHVPLRIADPQNATGNAIFWTARWDTDSNWPGFVYIQIDAVLERQEASHGDDPYPVRYKWDWLPKISFTDRPQPNYMKRTEGGRWYGPSDKENWFTEGHGGGSGGPENSVAAKPSAVTLRYTYPQPYLTPFEFILIECRTLFGDLVDFVTRYDPDFVRGLEIEEGAFTTYREDTLRAYPFSAPLVAFELQTCLIHLDFYIRLLESHASEDGDFTRQNPYDRYNGGRNRRFMILQRLASPNGLHLREKYSQPGFQEYRHHRPFLEIALRLRNIVSTYDPKAIAGIESMMDQADRIDTDAKRAFGLIQREATGFLFNYEGSAKGPAR